MIVTINAGKVVNIEGDPDHPINQGALCSKGAALYQVVNNKRRIRKVLYRAPYSEEWQERSLDWAIKKIAKRVKDTRDRSFMLVSKDGYSVNRTEAIASLGGAALNNEECYLWSKLSRALGLVYIEHQARICHSSTVAALGESFGRGAMTNHWIDIKNSDCIMIIGSNAAETHPLAFRWINKALENKAKLIHVDPRFTRTSSKADIYAPIRSGTDIAFIGGMINYCLSKEKYNKEYLVEYTNASFLVDPDFDFKEGLFSGYDREKRVYDKSNWRFQYNEDGTPKRDKSLKDPNCVFQLLKKHFQRYDLRTVCKITGTPKKIYKEICKVYCETGKKDRSGTIIYAMGATQHTHGTQNIRAYAILQLLLGNIGVAGGGINALRGESNVQGSTDHCLLFNILPGYLIAPTDRDKDLKSYLKRITPISNDPKSGNWWKNTPKYVVSLLKAFYGDNATKENEFCYQYLPKISRDYSYLSLFEEMYNKNILGLFVWGQNPAVSGANLNLEKKALENLEWMAVFDLWESETASFWKASERKPEEIKTEVFLIPVASSVEKEGSITNSGRWSQWRYKAIDPPKEAKPDYEIMDMLYKEIKSLYLKEGGTYPGPIVDLSWDYGEPIDPHKIAKEINGYELKNNRLLKNFLELKDDGSTSCGNWLYCGSYTQEGNKAALRNLRDIPSEIGVYPEWAWCWPLNRRILYNRASTDLEGNPWNEEKYVLKWDKLKKRWLGDIPDGSWPPGEKYPFIMKKDGVAHIFALKLEDGPFPEHYEPLESPTDNLLNPQGLNPISKIKDRKFNIYGNVDKYPIICTTYRLSEHWQAGAMSRNIPWLCELIPDMFVEISKTLARKKRIKHGDKVIISSARGKIKAYALITDRIRYLKINGKKVEQIALPWHFGYKGISIGDSANILTPHIGDAHTLIPEYKAFLVDVKKEV
jgi:formate dehydrogenase major subunit